MQWTREGGLRLRLQWLPEPLQRWRLQHGLFTGRWTQAEVDRVRQRARQLSMDMAPYWEQ